MEEGRKKKIKNTFVSTNLQKDHKGFGKKKEERERGSGNWKDERFLDKRVMKHKYRW